MLVEDTLAEVLSRAGLRQLHVAETEKYAHVTYFFNGGREEEWPGESADPRAEPRDVPSYDHKPRDVGARGRRRVLRRDRQGYAFGVINFANPDMVGHTGSIPAAVDAVETTDACLGRVVDAVTAAGGVCLITADHPYGLRKPQTVTRRIIMQKARRHTLLRRVIVLRPLVGIWFQVHYPPLAGVLPIFHSPY